jgi:hypothetical protein
MTVGGLLEDDDDDDDDATVDENDLIVFVVDAVFEDVGLITADLYENGAFVLLF